MTTKLTIYSRCNPQLLKLFEKAGQFVCPIEAFQVQWPRFDLPHGHLPRDPRARFARQLKFPGKVLETDFPDTGMAQHQIIGRIVDRYAGRSRQFLRLVREQAPPFCGRSIRFSEARSRAGHAKVATIRRTHTMPLCMDALAHCAPQHARQRVRTRSVMRPLLTSLRFAVTSPTWERFPYLG